MSAACHLIAIWCRTISVTPIITASVGHGKMPNGDAYRYVTHDSVLTKCGYVHPNTVIAPPAASHVNGTNVTDVSPKRATDQASAAARAANIVPLNGLPDIHATKLTDRSGATSRRPSRRACGRQLVISAKHSVANRRCHVMASHRQSFAIAASTVSNASGEGTPPPPEHVEAQSLPNGVCAAQSVRG